MDLKLMEQINRNRELQARNENQRAAASIAMKRAELLDREGEEDGLQWDWINRYQSQHPRHAKKRKKETPQNPMTTLEIWTSISLTALTSITMIFAFLK
jgi:hypothetical protein